MTPPARVAAAIECLDLVIAAAHGGGAAADTVVQRYFATRRYAGGGDRRAVRELVFACIRSLGEVPPSGRAALVGHARAHDPALLALFGAGAHAPAALAPGEPEAVPGLIPDWLHVELAPGVDTAPELAALLARAPLDLRVNTLKADREDVMAELPGTAPGPLSPWCLRAAPFAAEATDGFRGGRVEVQDEGSQLVALACAARPGMTVIDLCAGAGGKTLALAAAMANNGRLIACDTDRARLRQLAPRAERARAIVETRLLDPGHEDEALADVMGTADVVLVDAPCSGSGTWRRNPEARWRLTPERLDRLAQTQAALLDRAARLARPGGRMIYAVCSVLTREGLAQADTFTSRAPVTPAALGTAPDPAACVQLLTPHRHGCDGFTVAAWSKMG